MAKIPKPANKGVPPTMEDTATGFNPTRKNTIGRKTQINISVDMEVRREFATIAAENDMKHNELFEAYQAFWKKHH